MKTALKLDDLVKSGAIQSYSFQDVDEDGNIGKQSKFRNTEQLVLTFSNGETLKINTFCSGSFENTCLIFNR